LFVAVAQTDRQKERHIGWFVNFFRFLRIFECGGLTNPRQQTNLIFGIAFFGPSTVDPPARPLSLFNHSSLSPLYPKVFKKA